MGNYRYDLGIGDKYKFGTEIEFTGVNLERLIGIFKQKSLPIKYVMNHKSYDPKYNIWYLDEDCTVTKHILNLPIGGELSSRILTDTKETWLELKSICETLKSSNASVDATCSNHVRVCLSSIANKQVFFEVFSKLIAILEDEIALFFMGDTYLLRDTKSDYARDLKLHLLRYINEVNFQDEKEYFFDMRNARSGSLLFTNRDAINLNDFYHKGLIEIRYPNGTINEKTIQNNINFILKLIYAIERNLFDREALTSQVSKVERSDWFLDKLSGNYNNEGFEQLVRTISTSSEDVDDFMTQYERVLSMKKTVNK